MVPTQTLDDIRSLINDALEKWQAGDKGAPFEPPVLKALSLLAEIDEAEFHRMKAQLTDVGVSVQDLSQAWKQIVKAENSSPAEPSGQPLFTPEQMAELEKIGFEIDAYEGIVGIDYNIFAKHMIAKHHIRLTTGERFFYYKNGVWKPFRDKQLHRLLFREIENIQKNVWTSKWETGYMATIQRAAPYVEEFDCNRHYINLANGMYNTNTFQLEPHDPKYLSSIQNPMLYDAQAGCPRFLQFLDEIFQGDEQTIKVVQEIMGYCCTSETRAQKMFIFEGIGSNGKSVLIELIEHLVGRLNVSHVAMNELSHPFARAELVGKILNVSAENEFNEKGLNTQQIKTIVSGDNIRVENKYEKGFSYKPICKLVFALNALPVAIDKSHGFYRRLVIVPFRRVFKGTEVDKNLLQKLLEELPGIFNFAMEGLKRLIEQDFNFSTSNAINQAVSSYKNEQNPAIPFVADHIQAGRPEDRLGTNDLFEFFQVWCRRTGETEFAATTFRNRKLFYAAFKTGLLEAGLPIPDIKISNGWRYFPGLVLTKEPKNDISKLFDLDASDSNEPNLVSNTTVSAKQQATPKSVVKKTDQRPKPVKIEKTPVVKVPVSEPSIENDVSKLFEDEDSNDPLPTGDLPQEAQQEMHVESPEQTEQTPAKRPVPKVPKGLAERRPKPVSSASSDVS